VGIFREYVEAGWSLCGIDRGKKAPTYPRWNETPVPADTADGLDGAGLLHVQSQTCALDIDDLSSARLWLAERGVDLDGLLAAKDAIQISSGRVGRAKLLYRLKTPLRTFKPPGSGLELRCANLQGRSVQDVLPPSVHPETKKPYEWVFAEPLLGDWARLPAIPATLKAAWRALIDDNEPPAPRALNGDMDVALEKLHRWIKGQDSNMGYDPWLKVGMKLHHATGGAEEGLALWDGWSAKATRKFKSPPMCRAHWVSFSSPKGKIVATLDNELPAEADEFEIVTPSADTTDSKMQETARQQRQAAFTELEKRVVYVLASEKYFDTTRHRLIGSDSALEHQFTALMPRKNGKRINPVTVLKQSTTKRLVEGLAFHPGEGALFKLAEDTYANQYRNRLPAPLEPTKEENDKIDWIFARIEDGSYRHWIKQLYAHVVQQPGVKIRSAPLIWSDTQRNGKSTIIKTIPALLVGREYSQDVDYPLLTSDFNDYLQEAWHVNLAEFRAGTRGERTMVNNKLKAYIAEDTVPLHPKGGKGYTMPNHFFVTASSNDEDAASIDNNDERWGIYEFKQLKYTDAERQWIIYDFLLKPRAAAVLRWYFLHYSIDGFYPGGSAPMTDAKQDMVEASRPADKELLETMFEEQAEFFARDIVVVSEVQAYVHKHSVARPSATRVGKVLAAAPFFGVAMRFRIREKLFRGVIVRNHDRWVGRPGPELMAHITGGNDDIDILT
jgi:hypothetical protein